MANSVCIVIGGIIGVAIGKYMKDSMKRTIDDGLGLAVLFMGVGGVTLGGNTIIAVASLTLGAILGELIDIDLRLNNLGKKVQDLSKGKDDRFAQGFVTATLLVCTGAVAIVGSLESGMLGDPTVLITKAFVDGIIMVVMASTMGIGVVLSAVVLFIYQSGLVLLSGVLGSFLIPVIVTEISTVGAILIIGVGLNMLRLTKIKVGNMILSPFLAIPIYYLYHIIF